MGWGSGGSNDEARRAREDEQARQARIREGTQRINTIFDGGLTGSGKLGAGAQFDPSKQYFTADGRAWTPPNSGPPSLFGASGAGGTSFEDMVKAGKLFTGTENRSGFDDSFFEGRRNAFLDYSRPQLQEQYGDAQRDMSFALARGGLLDSSVRGEKAGELQQLYDLQNQNIADQARDYETQSRNAVEDARANLISTLNVTGDAEGAANAALARSAALSRQPAYSPLGQLFSDFTASLGQQAAQERAASMSGGWYRPAVNTGFFGNTGRVKVS